MRKVYQRLMSSGIVPLFVIAAAAIFVLIGVNRVLARREIVRAGSCKDCNVILISIGPLRAQSLPCYGYEKDSAPNLCGFAHSSMLFTRAYATASKTLDASFSIMTSLYPDSHKMNVPFVSVLDPRISTLPQVLQRSGYSTAYLGSVGDPHMPLTLGFDRGFDASYQADNPKEWIKTLQDIRKQGNITNNKYFVFLHTYAVHEPYFPTEDDFRKFYEGTTRVPVDAEKLCAFTYNKLKAIHPDRFVSLRATGVPCGDLAIYQRQYTGTESDFDETYTITNDAYWNMMSVLTAEEKQTYVHALYAASIYAFDRDFKSFLDYARDSGLLDHTIVVITGDHGDEFYEHGNVSHGETLYNEVIHVPLIISVPRTGPQRIDKLVSTVDIMPTILGVLGLRSPAGISGINALSARFHPMVIAEHVPDGLLTLITSTYKLVILLVNGRERHELYNLSSDPGEHQNLNSVLPAKGNLLQQIYYRMQSRFSIYTSVQKPLPSWLNTEEKQRLIRTGYF